MCVICTAPAGVMPSMEDLMMMAQANPDGIGFALRRPDGTFASGKSTDVIMILTHIQANLPLFVASDVLLHCRLATHGDVCADNCQPIALSGQEYFSHNGIAWAHLDGPFACDSRNLADAWAWERDPDMFAGQAVGVATLDDDGLHWLHGGIMLDQGIGVSNLHWRQNHAMI